MTAFSPTIAGAIASIAVGGISIGQVIQAVPSRGAKAVQIGSALMTEGPGICARVQQEVLAARTTQQTSA